MQCFIEEKLSPACLQTVLQTLAEGLFIIDKSGIIRYCNKALEQMTGKSTDQIIGMPCCSLMKEVCNPPPTCDLFTSGEMSNTECSVLHQSGKTIPVLKNARVLKDENGTVIGAVETITDITVLRNTEIQLLQLEQKSGKKEGFGKIVGKSNLMLEVFNLIELAAASNATVLITGETGTGKELAAFAIHDSSPRRNGPFIKLNCSALPEALLESELFGHARGSFTGAIKDKIGRFELADGGTLFLDEIGELSPLIQVKLLRFLQEKEFERVGENTTRKTDVRIITATHRNLRNMIQTGTFREDLFYRLKVFPINIPSLRDRKEDIGPLIDHFIKKFKEETGKNISGLSHDAAVTMMDYCWPGNIRELENAIEHAFVTCRESLIGMFDLPLEIRKVELRKGICFTSSENSRNIIPKALYEGRRPLTDEAFRNVVAECDGNQSEVARRLGIDRTTVWRKMKKLKNL
jgi:PAS domain S-box-containing protein